MRCRICRTARNLKYTSQQLRLQIKASNIKNKLRLPLSAIPQTTGNICYDCDERLQNFHKLDDDSDVVDVDSNGFHGIQKRQVDIPVVVDDDKRFYDILYKNAALQCNEKPTMITNCQNGNNCGDPEVIDLLTSRETTPDIMANLNSNRVLNSTAVPVDPTIIAVIDLEEYEETDQGRQNETSVCNIPAKIEKKETRLLGCLNLISSEDESEINFEPCTLEKELVLKNRASHEVFTGIDLKAHSASRVIECTNNNNINFNDTGVTIQHNKPVCHVCGINFSDKQSLEVHMSDHEDFKCPVCDTCFNTPLELVNHMRQKHRSFDGNDLCEGARCSQDSAMTIRLRYKQRFTFYECQLCGLIDSKFKEHKTHIMQRHADESKSLRDPMMKTQLKCPSCHQTCGTNQVDVCRHLLTQHETEESSQYLQEVVEVKIPGLNPKLIETIRHEARFLTLGPKEQIFFQCLLCKQVSGTYRTFSRHSNGHNIDEWKNYRTRELRAVSSPVKPRRTLKRKLDSSYTSEYHVMQTKFIAKTEDQPALKKPKLEYDAIKKALAKYPKLKIEEVVAKKLQTSAQKYYSKNLKTELLISSDAKRQKKFTHKLANKSQNKKGQQKAVTKVKVKPPLRNFPTQKYNCKYCRTTFKGFRKLQLHLINSHRSEEFFGCENCTKAFTTQASLDVHQTENICRRKRKFHTTIKLEVQNQSTQNIDRDNLDENSNKEDRNICKYQFNSPKIELPDMKTFEQHTSSSLQTHESSWLSELLQLSREKSLQSNMTNISTAIDICNDSPYLEQKGQQFETTMQTQTLCRYCGCLESSVEELISHEKNHIALKDMPWINYNQFNQNVI